MVGTALTARTTNRNYPAPIAILSCVYEGTQVPIDAGLAIESKYFGQLLAGPVARNLMRTMFVNKGLADKLARRPAGPPKSQVRRLGILGAGMMGAGVAYVSARAGMDVVLLDSTIELAEKGKGYSRQLLAKDVGRGKRTQAESDAVLARIKPTVSYDDLAGVDLVIEAVFESREIKADVTAKAEAVIPRNAVFGSNTSTLPITGLAQASKRPAQFIGVHFFSPVDKMPLVEIIVGKKTSDDTLARALDYVGQLRKTPIVVNDSRGFYTSRCFGTFVYEGMAMLQEGVNPALIENAAKRIGMPVGPLAVADEVTIDLQWKVIKQTEADLGRRFVKPVAYEVVQKFVEELNRPGRRFGAGFYDYPEGAKKHLWPGLSQVFPRAVQQPSAEEVQKRLMYIQALETTRCMEEGVVTTPGEADLGSILGWGFPAWTGGTLSYIDTIGVREFVAECDRLAKRYGKRFKPSKWLRERADRGEPFHPAPATTDRAA
jgi:3-hydroxyacyl-CoA dehydrogenase/enoyl-CoA hydratase/3-hydroxybutyryl-CoA epimerase